MASLLGVAMMSGCPGEGATAIGEPPEGFDPDLRGPAPNAVVVSLRRLTRTQLHYTVHDLLGDALPSEFDVRAMLPPDDEHGGFASNSTVPPSELTIQQLERAMEAVVAAALLHKGKLEPCLDASPPESTCASEWIERLAARAFRRPVQAEELEPLHELVMLESPPAGAAPGDAMDAAIERGLLALLLSPDFLYRVERGQSTLQPGVRRLSDYEIAARLSYLLWSSMPDDALRAEAAAGRLSDRSARIEQFDRMFADPRTRRGLADFHTQWLELSELDSIDKDRNVFPTWNDSLRPLLRQEFETFVDFAIRHDDGRLSTLLLSPMSFIAPALAPWYAEELEELEEVVELPPGLGLPEGAVAVRLPEGRRAGVLSRLAPLVVHATAGQSAPSVRGALVRRRLLCETLVAPAEIPMGATEPEPGESQRDQLQRHAEDPACASCHALIDPVGLLLEPYDAMGAFVTEDLAGNPIDARGAVPRSDIEGALDGPIELQQALAASEQVQRCHVTEWLSYALGRPPTADDEDVVASITERFVASDGHVPTLLRALVGSEVFIHRREP